MRERAMVVPTTEGEKHVVVLYERPTGIAVLSVLQHIEDGKRTFSGVSMSPFPPHEPLSDHSLITLTETEGIIFNARRGTAWRAVKENDTWQQGEEVE